MSIFVTCLTLQPPGSGVSITSLRQDRVRESHDKDTQPDGKQVGAGGDLIAAPEKQEAGLVGGDLLVDPGLVVGHTSVDSREVGQRTTLAKTHDPSLGPTGVIFDHHRAA